MGPDQPSPGAACRHEATPSPPERLLAGWLLGLLPWVLLLCPPAAAQTPPGRLPFVPYGAEVGLGLGVVRKLVLLYGGTVEVRSEVGQGTCFVLTLPRGGARSSG